MSIAARPGRQACLEVISEFRRLSRCTELWMAVSGSVGRPLPAQGNCPHMYCLTYPSCQHMHANMLRHTEVVLLSPWTLARCAKPAINSWVLDLAIDPCLVGPWQPVRASSRSGKAAKERCQSQANQRESEQQHYRSNIPHRAPPASRTPVAPRLTALRRLARVWCTLAAAPDCSPALPVLAPAGRESPLASLRMLLAAPSWPAAGTCSFSPAPCQHHGVRS